MAASFICRVFFLSRERLCPRRDKQDCVCLAPETLGAFVAWDRQWGQGVPGVVCAGRADLESEALPGTAVLGVPGPLHACCF